jgi:DNA repair protein RadC
MKSLKSIAITIGMLVLSFSLGFSQADEQALSQEEITALRSTMKANTASLNLTEEQLSKFEEIAKRYGDQLMELRESDASKFSKYRKMKSIKKSRNKEMQQLLSEEQYERYLKNQEAMEKKMKEYREN